MKLAALIGTSIRDWADLRSFVIEAERIGLDSVWSAEFNGHDAFAPLAFVGANTQTLRLGTGVVTIGTRTPALLAMSGVTLSAMSDGRFILGLGANSRAGMEAWHGAPFHPASKHLVEMTRAVRKVAAGEPAEFEGSIYLSPRGGYPALALEPGLATPFPIYFASLSEKSLEAAGEVADGWVGGASFMPMLAETFRRPMEAGAARAGRSLTDFDFMAPAFLMRGERERVVAMLRSFVAGQLAQVGQWEGSHHAAVYERAGYAELVESIRADMVAGRADQAAARVPAEFVTSRCLVGDDAEVRITLRAYRDSGVSTIQLVGLRPPFTAALDGIARVRHLMNDLEP